LALAGAVCSPAPISCVQTAPTAPPDFHADPRLALLRSFFAKAACPALEYSPAFLEAADRYKLDWRLLPSLSFVESTCGKFARNNNFFGWNSGKADFGSPAAAIHQVGYRLSHSSLYRFKKLDAILALYNQRAEYAVKVKSVMRRIAAVE
jgi:hypothetical protein